MTQSHSPQPPACRSAMLYRLSQTFNQSLDLDELLNRVLNEIIIATQTESGYVMLKNDNNVNLEFKLAHGIDTTTIEGSDLQFFHEVVERVMESGEHILSNDAQFDERFGQRRSVMLLGLFSILCVPLQQIDKILVVIYVDNCTQAVLFIDADLDLMSAMAANAAIAIENARLYHLAVEKGMEHELQMPRRVQYSLLPAKLADLDGWEFASFWQPARVAAGDYYDFIDDQLGLAIADITDKGMPAALFMVITRSIIHAYMDRAQTPKDGIKQANRLTCLESTLGLFVNYFFTLLDPSTCYLTYVNAGHNPSLFHKA